MKSKIFSFSIWHSGHQAALATVFAAVVLAMGSCRETSDNIVSYGQYDVLNFAKADSTYAEQFHALWTAMNCNYGIWDYESEHGLDWDAVHDKYLPKMQELDKRLIDNNSISDDEFKALYEEILAPLHDGHLAVQLKNLGTGTYISVSPSRLRNASRSDYDLNANDSLDFYKTEAAGENQMVLWSETRVRPYPYIMSQIDSVLVGIDFEIARLEAVDNPTDLDGYYLDNYRKVRQELSTFSINDMNDIYYFNNTLATKYHYLGIQFRPFDLYLNNPSQWINMASAVFSDGIAYLAFSGFYLDDYLTGKVKGTPCGDYFCKQVAQTYSLWFNAIQQLKKNGQLKGVIIDLRGNGGGSSKDYQYALGALLPAEGHPVATSRNKNGVGRYDFAPSTTLTMQAISMEHEVISQEPIVVLANCNTVSMAEITCLGAKALDNARVIGTRTWGGLCLLSPPPSTYSINYASCVGEEGVTPFYAYIPTGVTIAPQGGILEGVGVTPDIEAPLDRDLQETTGRDSQLERALQYIRTGN